MSNGPANNNQTNNYDETMQSQIAITSKCANHEAGEKKEWAFKN
jgi:hypothetical protein